MKIFVSVCLIMCCGLLGLSGCAVIETGEFLAPSGDPNDEYVFRNYDKVILKESNAAEVMEAIYSPEYELLSQSESVMAVQGERKRGHEVWFDMVAFDEDNLTASRKYLLVVDERPKTLFVDPWTSFRLNSEAVIDEKVLSEPYADDNARRIAIMKNYVENFRNDKSEVMADNKKIKVYGMMVNQVMETVLLKLKEMPALAIRLDEPEGIEFDHINLDKGKIRMIVVDDIASIQIRAGLLANKLKWSEDVNDY